MCFVNYVAFVQFQALEAIHQFHVKDRPNRKQYYYLNYLCPDTGTVITLPKLKFYTCSHNIMDNDNNLKTIVETKHLPIQYTN